jgi:hypothetical protein
LQVDVGWQDRRRVRNLPILLFFDASRAAMPRRFYEHTSALV